MYADKTWWAYLACRSIYNAFAELDYSRPNHMQIQNFNDIFPRKIFTHNFSMVLECRYIPSFYILWSFITEMRLRTYLQIKLMYDVCLACRSMYNSFTELDYNRPNHVQIQNFIDIFPGKIFTYNFSMDLKCRYIPCFTSNDHIILLKCVYEHIYKLSLCMM